MSNAINFGNALEFDTSHQKVFETKTSPIYGFDSKSGGISTTELNPTRFSLVIYARSKESENNNTTKSDEYYMNLLADTPDVIEMKKLPFSEWHKFIEEHNYVHISEAQVKAAFDKVHKLINEQKAKEKEAKNV